MPNKLQCEQSDENKMEKHERESLDDLIREQVIHALGTPSDLRKCKSERSRTVNTE